MEELVRLVHESGGNRDEKLKLAKLLEDNDFQDLLRHLALQTTRGDSAAVFSVLGVWREMAGKHLNCFENADFVEALVGALRATIADSTASGVNWKVRM